MDFALRNAAALDLNDLVEVSSGRAKPTNHHRALMAAIAKDRCPATWQRYTAPAGVAPAAWVADFVRRIDRLWALCAASLEEYGRLPIHLGRPGAPEAFVPELESWDA